MSELVPVVITHEGRHHADELLACWFMRKLLGECRIVRTSDPYLWKRADVLLDCGGEYAPERHRYDHHGGVLVPSPPSSRSAGYATSGLVWLSHGPRIVQILLEEFTKGNWQAYAKATPPAVLAGYCEDFSKILDYEIVAPLDAWDLGIYPPREATKGMLPCQWILPHLNFDVAMEAMGDAFQQRLWNLADALADEYDLESSLVNNGPGEFYLCGDWLAVLAKGGRRIEVKAAKRFAASKLEMPLLAVISPFRAGSKWGAFFTLPLPEDTPIPPGIQWAAGRRSFFHRDPMRLLEFVRSAAHSKGLQKPLGVGRVHA